MIYLIDDKRKRQKIDFGFNEDKINNFVNELRPIYDLQELIVNSQNIFKKGNTVLYHESFLDNSLYSNEALDKRKHLEEFAKTNSDFNLVFFSGSKSNRNFEDNVVHLPVSILYSNLEAFLYQVQEEVLDLNFLLFGNKPEIENELNEKLKIALREIEAEAANIPNQKSLVFRTTKNYIQNAIENAEEETLFNKDISDAKFTDYIEKYLDKVKYDNIFIPLCFGSILSDYNGLRLATLIRCTDTMNQLTNVYLYGFVGMDYILNHECFNILKTKNVKLIPFQKSAFQKTALEVKEVLTKEELPNEIQKLKLNIPKDFDDNHAITNEWAIYKWNFTIPNPIYDKIDDVLDTVENRLYFKYLQTLYPTSKFSSIRETELNFLNSFSGKVLLIDDNYKKGWFDIFKSLFKASKDLQFDKLEINYRTLSRDQIIEDAYNSIIDTKTQEINYDVIILDFRLHSSDNNEVNIDLISGMQILNKIKEFNPGIQVIIFSATHRIWNLQLLQNAGADGFVIKENVENSLDSEFSKNNIISCLNLIKHSLKREYLKKIWLNIDSINTSLKSNPLKKYFTSNFELLKALSYQNLILEELELSYTILESEQKNKYAVAMLSMYKIIECLADIFVTSETANGILLFWDNTEVKFCKYSDRTYTLISKNNVISSHSYKSTSNKVQCLIREKLNLEDDNISQFIFEISKYRNDYIHPDNRFNLTKLESSKISNWFEKLKTILIKM
ncbi:response regulator [Winogradskyella sp. UBA3174]|uniref:response regulator n=1 Tax=Winogradskyella sp. UBA3174 TaxID=1947785 RepID=UPI0025D110AF|nr:response regulator [Winogradskyella sp. UBA3174]